MPYCASRRPWYNAMSPASPGVPDDTISMIGTPSAEGRVKYWVTSWALLKIGRIH